LASSFLSDYISLATRYAGRKKPVNIAPVKIAIE
jgi:hypothetical protein